MRIATIEDNIIVNITISNSLQEGIEHFPGNEVISIEDSYSLLLDDGSVTERWLGIGWRRDGDTWIPPFTPLGSVIGSALEIN